jgi:hypothetical protein
VWADVENSLRQILQDAVESSNLTEEQTKKYFLSATEAEIEEGIIPYIKPTPFQKKLLSHNEELLHIDPNHLFAFLRDIKQESIIGRRFSDASYEKVQTVKEHIQQIVPKKNILHLKTTQTTKEKLKEEYLEEFATQVTKFIKCQIDLQYKKEQAYKQTLTPLQLECQAQTYFAQTKRKEFIAQTQPLLKIQEYIKSTATPNYPLIIYAKSGMGKSALLAQAIKQSQLQTEKKIIYRFVGATPASNNSQDILESLFEELGFDLRDPKHTKDTSKTHKLVDATKERESFEKFSKRVHATFFKIEESVVIFIDAIDQVTNEESFLWLPQQLPSNVKVIISTLKDSAYEEDSRYFQTLSEKLKKQNLYKLQLFTEPKTLLLNLLAKYNRRVTEEQLHYFLRLYKKVQTPLYVTMAAQKMRHWKSDATQQTLSATQKGIIKEYISNLWELYHHDKSFVKKVLGYIYASQDGLSENEIITLLETDTKFIESIASEKYHKNLTKELPMVHWSRFFTMLSPFLSVKAKDNEELLYFFHREFEDAVAKQAHQKSYHQDIILALQKLIVQDQHKPFEANRWGKLYSDTTTHYLYTFENAQNYKLLTHFLLQVTNKKWIEGYIEYILKNASLYDYAFNKKAYLELLKIKWIIEQTDIIDIKSLDTALFFHKLGGYEYLHLNWAKALKSLKTAVKLLQHYIETNHTVEKKTAQETLSQTYGRIGEMFSRYATQCTRLSYTDKLKKVTRSISYHQKSEAITLALLNEDSLNIELNRKLGVVYERFATAYSVIDDNANIRKYFAKAFFYKNKSYNRTTDFNGFAMRKLSLVITNYYLKHKKVQKAKLYIKVSLKSLTPSAIDDAISQKNQYYLEQYMKLYTLASLHINTDYKKEIQKIELHLKERGIKSEY